MRSATAYTEYVLSQSSQTQTETKKSRKKSRSGWWFVLERLAAVMVVGAVFQFIRRLIVLVIGILRLTYRKVASYNTYLHQILFLTEFDTFLLYTQLI